MRRVLYLVDANPVSPDGSRPPPSLPVLLFLWPQADQRQPRQGGAGVVARPCHSVSFLCCPHTGGCRVTSRVARSVPESPVSEAPLGGGPGCLETGLGAGCARRPGDSAERPAWPAHVPRPLCERRHVPRRGRPRCAFPRVGGRPRSCRRRTRPRCGQCRLSLLSASGACGPRAAGHAGWCARTCGVRWPCQPQARPPAPQVSECRFVLCFTLA